MSVQRTMRPTGVTLLAAVLFLFGLFAFFGSLFMWGEGFLLSFPSGVDYRFPVTDILVNAPASLLAAIGLWKMKAVGLCGGSICGGLLHLWFSRDLCGCDSARPPFPIEIVIPQVAAVITALFLVFYL